MGSTMSLPAEPMVSGRLLRTLVEELKLPLMQIARQAELARLEPGDQLLKHIEIAAVQALWFIDSYVLSHQTHHGQLPLRLEPVTVSGVLYDTAHVLERLAWQYDCKLELDLGRRLPPVMANRHSLQTALIGLGTTLVMAASQRGDQKPRIVLAGRKGKAGIMAGVFSECTGLSPLLYRQAQALQGSARQPLKNLTAQAGAGVFMADALFEAMATQLQVMRYRSLTGLAATLQPSSQLSLV